MSKWTPCARKTFIRKLRQLGFDAPERGGNHAYMRYGTYTLTLPSNREYSVAQVKMLLKEIEDGMDKTIPLEEWEKL